MLQSNETITKSYETPPPEPKLDTCCNKNSGETPSLFWTGLYIYDASYKGTPQNTALIQATPSFPPNIFSIKESPLVQIWHTNTVQKR